MIIIIIIIIMYDSYIAHITSIYTLVSMRCDIDNSLIIPKTLQIVRYTA